MSDEKQVFDLTSIVEKLDELLKDLPELVVLSVLATYAVHSTIVHGDMDADEAGGILLRIFFDFHNEIVSDDEDETDIEVPEGSQVQ